ncbi:MAG TPA: hypothetical protein VF172_10870 [Nitrososphaera sp.]|jgi:hypothetical protein
MKQERVSYKEAQNIVCENCGHYMSARTFMETEMSNCILDDDGEMKWLSDKEVEELNC